MPDERRGDAEDTDGARRRGPIAPAPTTVTAFVGRTRRPGGPVPRRVRSWLEFDETFGGAWRESLLPSAVRQFFINGGREALICAVDTGGAPLESAHVSAPALEARREGLWQLADTPVNLICIPPFQHDVEVDRGTWDAAIALAWRRRAVVLVDPPRRWRSMADITATAVDEIVTPHEACANAALYVPRLRCLDPAMPGGMGACAPSGAVAGVIARTDARRGVWRAPAGLEARFEGVQGLTLAFSDADQNDLNRRGINALRSLPGGHVIWGARTMRGDDALGSDWKYLPVRRLALYIESSILEGTRWASSEPGDPTLWAALRTDIDEFLHGLYLHGAFHGRSPEEAWFVHCDETTTSAEDVQDGVAGVVVGFAPLAPSEFVVLKLNIKTAR